MSNKQLASVKEQIVFGSLGNKFECPEMVSQLKVMYDNIDPKSQGCDKDDIIRLFEIKQEIIQAILTLEIINDLSQ